MANPQSLKVLITGFGPFLDILTNPSCEIARRLPGTLAIASNTTVQIIVPPEPIPAKYHDILALTRDLINEHEPNIVVHMGLAHGRKWFAVEKGAEREGYQEIPDMAKRVFTRGENKKVFGKGEARLESSLELEAAVDVWREEVKGLVLPGQKESLVDEGKEKSKKGKQKENRGANSHRHGSKQQVDVRLSDDVGNYVCGFMYYVSLLEMQKITEKQDSVFFHVPYLEGEEEIEVGVRVTEELIRALVGVWEGRG